MARFQWWLHNNARNNPFEPEPELSSQETQPIPIQAPPMTPERRRALAAKPNCVLCLAEFAEHCGDGPMPFEAGGYGLCIDCESWVEAQPRYLRETVIEPYLKVLYRRFDPAHESAD